MLSAFLLDLLSVHEALLQCTLALTGAPPFLSADLWGLREADIK